jgi:hypothetical protein
MGPEDVIIENHKPQLGLNVTATKGPIDIINVASAERPTQNRCI